MYTLLSAYVRPLATRAQWDFLPAATVGAMTLRTLYQTYERVYLQLENDYLPGNHVLDMQTVFSTAMITDVSVADWLAGLGNQSLPTTVGTLTPSSGRVRYSDAIQAGYHVRLCDRLAHLDTVLPIEDQEDLLVSRADITDYADLNDYFLYSVNGFMHRGVWTAAGIQIYDGGSTFQRSKDNGVGLWSFRSIGKVECHDIADGLIVRNMDNEPLSERVYLNTNVDLNGKTVFLVLGGRFHFQDDVFKVIGDRQLMIDFNAFNAEQWILEAQRHLNLDYLNIPYDERNANLVTPAFLTSDAFIEAVLNLSQTFIVTLDCDALATQWLPVGGTRLPRAYISRLINDEPLFGAYGFTLDYKWIAERYFGYVLRTIDNRRHRYLVSTQADDVMTYPFDEARESYKGSDLARAHFRRLFVDKLDFTPAA